MYHVDSFTVNGGDLLTGWKDDREYSGEASTDASAFVNHVEAKI